MKKKTQINLYFIRFHALVTSRISFVSFVAYIVCILVSLYAVDFVCLDMHLLLGLRAFFINFFLSTRPILPFSVFCSVFSFTRFTYKKNSIQFITCDSILLQPNSTKHYYCCCCDYIKFVQFSSTPYAICCMLLIVICCDKAVTKETLSYRQFRFCVESSFPSAEYSFTFDYTLHIKSNIKALASFVND